MAGNTFGTNFKVTTFGESHGAAIGAVIDGCPAGISLCEDDFNEAMLRRNPENTYTTSRKEVDKVHIMSGVFNDLTLGTPISVLVYNEAFDSSTYDDLKDIYRPGHADMTYDNKFGIRDYNGGGRASGRETAARVMAGVVAQKILDKLNIKISAKVVSIGGSSLDKANALLDEAKSNGDSLGGITECVVSGIPAGIGEPVFDKLEALLAHAMLSIPGSRGFEIGDGFKITDMKGSEANDGFCFANGKISKKTNHSGGVLGGISDGDDIYFRVAFKPTPSIFISQETVTKDGNETSVEIKGKHDVCYCLRTPVIVEAMTQLVLADLILSNKLSKIDNL